MTMLTPAEIRAKVQKLWDSQRLFRAWLDDEPLFPLEISTRLPSGRELAERYGEVRTAIASLHAGSRAEVGHGYRLVDEEVAHRQLGAQRLPVKAVLDDREEALRLIGKVRDFQRFVRLAQETRERFPALEGLLRARPLAILELTEEWPRLLRFCAYMQTHPRPGCYLRAIDLPGIDTKFLEAHKGMLAEMLDAVLPDEAVERDAKGIKAFERRYGFLHDPPGVRFRWLDPGLAPMGLLDMQVPLEAFAHLDPPVERVFFTENKVNFLAFPDLPRSMVVFGQGYGIRALADIPWFRDCTIHYWGDLDTHGFSILSELRAGYPEVRSLLMDEATLLAHRESWGEEPAEVRVLAEPPYLTPDEADLYRGLRDGRWRDRLRLEQERIAYGWLLSALSSLRASQLLETEPLSAEPG